MISKVLQQYIHAALDKILVDTILVKDANLRNRSAGGEDEDCDCGCQVHICAVLVELLL